MKSGYPNDFPTPPKGGSGASNCRSGSSPPRFIKLTTAGGCELLANVNEIASIQNMLTNGYLVTEIVFTGGRRENVRDRKGAMSSGTTKFLIEPGSVRNWERLVITGRFSVRRERLRIVPPPLELEQVPEQTSTDPGDIIEFPHDHRLDPLTVRIGGRNHALTKIPYRLLRWVHWLWINEGRTEFDFVDLALHVWEDEATRKDTIESTVKRLREFLALKRAAFSVRYEREILYITK